MRNHKWPGIMSDYCESGKPVVMLNIFRIAINAAILSILLFAPDYLSVSKYLIFVLAMILSLINEMVFTTLRKKVKKSE